MEIVKNHSLESVTLTSDIKEESLQILPGVKEESLQILPSIKEELPNLFFPQYRTLQDFTSDEESRLDGELALRLAETSDDSDGSCDFKNKSRRNRRKPLLPQKTVQSEISQTGSAGTSSECSQDATENIMLNFTDSFINSTADGHFLEFADGDDLLQDIDEENIFKGIQEEAGKFNIMFRKGFYHFIKMFT